MSSVVGGLRQRLIRDSIYHCIYDALDARGWFDSGRKHLPIQFTGDITPQDEEIAFNSLALSDESLDETDLEMGSTAVETEWTFYLDFFAEDDSIGKDVIGDIRDILGGRMSSVGRSDASVEVMDYRMATPTPLFRVYVENIIQDRAHDFPKPWQKHWYLVRFTVLDYYTDDAIS